jgi:integrase
MPKINNGIGRTVVAKVNKLSNGKWQVRFRDLEKRQRAQNFDTKKEAEAFCVNIEYELKHGTWLDYRKGDTQFEHVWRQFIQLKAAKKPNTIADYTTIWRVHLGPKWGKIPVNRISQNSFDKWILDLGLSARRTRKIHLIASMILDVAVNDELIRKNPLKDATGKRDGKNLPVIPKRQVGVALTLDELFRLAGCAGFFRDHILFLGLTGIRWGEFVALKVSDLDLKKGIIKIEKSLSEIDGKLILSQTTKTHQDREVLLVDHLLKCAPSWISGKGADDYLFTSPTGAVLRNSNFARRVLNPALKAANLPHIRIHDLRWTAISIASSLGISQQVVRIQVGHSNAHMTNAYTHIFKADQTEAATKLGKAVNEVHEKCTNDETTKRTPEIENQNHAQNEATFGLIRLEGWLRQQDYESGALTN